MTDSAAAFRTVFVADPAKVHWATPIVFVVGAVGLYVASRWIQRTQARGLQASLRFYGLRIGAAGSGIGAVLAAFITFSEYRLCSTPIGGPDVAVVQGTVRDFSPMPPTGHALERFAVDGVSFGFSGIGESCTFNQAAVFGGPLWEGRTVRVFYKHGRILRLDVGK